MIDPGLFHPSVIFQYFNQHSVLRLGDESTGIIAYLAWNDELMQTSKPLIPIDLGINRISDDEPETTFPGMVWVDTSTPMLKVRNEADDDWYSLGLVIGTDVLAYDAGLLSLAGLTYVSDSFIKVTATDTYAIRTIAETKIDLSLNNVENTTHSTDAHTMTIDGRDVSVDGTKLDGIASGADVTGSNAPQAHKASHQNGGGDEISIAELSGLLADDQHVLDAEVVTAAKTVKLDDFTAPDDNTDLDASAALHGLMSKVYAGKLDGIASGADVTGDNPPQAHPIASHSDTTGTGAELDTLTDDSMADALHRHSELSASDGTPNQALVVDATGQVGIKTASPGVELHIRGATPFLTIQSDSDNVDMGMYIKENSGALMGSFSYDFSAFSFRIVTSINRHMVLTTSGAGNVGIRAESPNHGLSVIGNVSIGNNPPVPSANGTYVLTFDDNTADPTMDTNTCGFYGKDVSGTVEAFAVDEADNETQLTPHAFKLFQPDKTEPYPWSYYGRNKMLGKEINVDMAGAIRAIEVLSGKKFIHYADVPKEPKDIVSGKRKAWKVKWIEENTGEAEIEEKDAIELIAVSDEEIIFSFYTKYEKRYTYNDGLVCKHVPVYTYGKKLGVKLKDNVRLDGKTGKFYETIIPSEDEAEIAADADFSYKIPAWLAERMK